MLFYAPTFLAFVNIVLGGILVFLEKEKLALIVFVITAIMTMASVVAIEMPTDETRVLLYQMATIKWIGSTVAAINFMFLRVILKRGGNPSID